MRITREVFFRGDAVGEERVTIPARVYNNVRLLLQRADIGTGCVFVPIRSMQFLGVITADEVVFVDSQAYAVQGGVGGRLILIAWQFDAALHRDSLSEPVPITVVHYVPGHADTQRRLLGDFHVAVTRMLERNAEHGPGRGMNVVSIGSRRD